MKEQLHFDDDIDDFNDRPDSPWGSDDQQSFIIEPKVSALDVRKAKKIIDGAVEKGVARDIVVEGLRMVADAKAQDQDASVRTDLRPHDDGDDGDYNKDYPYARTQMDASVGTKFNRAPGSSSYNFYHSDVKDELPSSIQDKADRGDITIRNPREQSLHTRMTTTGTDGTSLDINIEKGRKQAWVSRKDTKTGKVVDLKETERPATARTHKAALRLMNYKLRKSRNSKSSESQE